MSVTQDYVLLEDIFQLGAGDEPVRVHQYGEHNDPRDTGALDVLEEEEGEIGGAHYQHDRWIAAETNQFQRRHGGSAKTTSQRHGQELVLEREHQHVVVV